MRLPKFSFRIRKKQTKSRFKGTMEDPSLPKTLFYDDLPPVILINCKDYHCLYQLALISFCLLGTRNVFPSATLPRT
jgi:hypothetical protein